MKRSSLSEEMAHDFQLRQKPQKSRRSMCLPLKRRHLHKIFWMLLKSREEIARVVNSKIYMPFFSRECYSKKFQEEHFDEL